VNIELNTGDTTSYRLSSGLTLTTFSRAETEGDMFERIVIRPFEVVGSSLCVASEDGERVHALLKAALAEKRQVDLSFENISVLTPAFLNSAVGQLYGEFPEEAIRDSLSVRDMFQEDADLLRHVVKTAKSYFSSPDRLCQARQEVLGEDDEQ
jgi:hypothetical protein